MPTHCIEEECKTRASFNYKENKNPLYCKKHAKENMINIKSRKCLETNNFYNRYEKLKERFEFWLANKPSKEITIEYLFYS